MSQPGKPFRSWKTIAAELANEQDIRKVTELAEELEAALGAQTSLARSGEGYVQTRRASVLPSRDPETLF